MLFCQLDYPQELGTGTGYTIAEYGCALVAVASLIRNTFNKDTDPAFLNDALIDIKGYGSNGIPKVFDLLDWTAISRIYPDLVLTFNIPYYNPPDGQSVPADMNLIDKQLSDGFSVIVGVSFAHNPKEPTPTHYVELYRKNADGTYQMRDPMFRGNECDTVFDTRYAVNGMSVANCILQAISYSGPINSPSVSPSPSSSNSASPSSSVSSSPSSSPSVSASPSPEASIIDTPVEEIKASIPTPSTIPQQVAGLPTNSQTITTLKEAVHKLEIERNNAISKASIIADKYEEDFKNYTGLVAAGYDTVEKVDSMVKEAKNEVTKHRKQLVQVLKSAEDMGLVYAAKCKEDYSAIEAGSDAIEKVGKLEKELEAVAYIHKAKPTFSSIATAWDTLLTKYTSVKRKLEALQTPQTKKIELQVINNVEKEKPQWSEWINMLFGIHS